jgi:hypothetical protein
MSLDNKIPEIHSLIRKHIERLTGLRLILITPNQWLRVYNKRIEIYSSHAELHFIRGLRPYRGDILNFFAKLEFIVSELIQARFLGLFSEKAYEFDDLLGKIDFEQKIRLLKQWNVIDNNLLSRIQDIFKVRNQLAHIWDEKEVFYGKDTEGNKVSLIGNTENFEKFKKAGESVWLDVVQIFMAEEEKHFGKLITKLDDPNTINAWEDITAQSGREDSD